jgi:GT2 family glycosyltransferase
VVAVVIGRNEGERLLRCLRGAAAQADRVVYVDSGSTDGSAAAAAALGATVALLDDSQPFSAARARNAGVAAARAPGAPTPRYVQFIDGDCELQDGWIPAAAAFLDARPEVAAVCGRRRERRPEASLYNRLCDMEWNTPVGETRACGGDVLMRLEAFEAAGGFDPAMVAGEEPELCVRLRKAGWTIWRLDREMTLHDAAMDRFSQWRRRTLRSGWAYAEGAARHGAPPERHNVAALRSIVLWGGLVPAATATAALGAVVAAALGGLWSPLLGLAALGVAAYPAMAVRIALRRRRRGDPWGHAAPYGVFTMIGKPVQMAGVLRRMAERRRGAAARIIEYKAAP